VKSWLAIGGRRLDCANSYDTQMSVAQAMRESGVPRKDIFLLQKIGNTNAMGWGTSKHVAPAMFAVRLLAPSLLPAELQLQ
jgi:diketogulonate reductase-like aldo/keto reductase